MEASLKVKNYPSIAGFVFGNLWLLHLIFFGDTPDLSWTQELSKLIPAAVAGTVFAVAITELFNGNTKAVLVFRRFKHALPGSRAFSELGPKDPRVDMEKLASRYGSLPTDPTDQNKLWYRIFKLNESRPSIAYAHQYYLLMRDLAFVTVFLVLGAIACALVLRASLTVWLTVGVLLVAELMLAMRSAESLGSDLVRNALAEESART